MESTHAANPTGSPQGITFAPSSSPSSTSNKPNEINSNKFAIANAKILCHDAAVHSLYKVANRASKRHCNEFSKMAKFQRAQTYAKTKSIQFDKDDYETSHSTLNAVLSKLDPLKHLIFEPFPGTGYSTMYMQQCGFRVTNGDYCDFFQHCTPPRHPAGTEGMEMFVITNPPYSKKKDVLKKLKDLGLRNLALLLPSGTVSNKYWRQYFPQDNFQLLINIGRCKFLSPETHKPLTGSCNFTVFWCLNNFRLKNDISYFK